MQLRLDYGTVMQQTNEMDRLASELDCVKTDVNSIVAELDSVWQGEASERYANHCINIETSVKNLSCGVNRTADTIRRIAELVREAEEESQRIAEKMRVL